MTVFKTFFKVLMQYKAMVILYTVMLVGFGAFTFTTNSGMTDFSKTKPDIMIIDYDNSLLSESINNYMAKNANIKEVDSIDDALFYRDISYVITIPDNFSNDFINEKEPNIEIKTNDDYNSSYANMLLEKYLKIANVYRLSNYSESEIISKTEKILAESIQVEMTSKLDTSSLSKASFYFSFLSYSLLASCVFIIAITMSSFKDDKIKKRTMISSIKNHIYNKSLFLSGCVFGIALWIVYIIISIILLKNTMFTIHGLLYIINSFNFLICCLAISFLIGNTTKNKEAIGGIVNVIALGSSFLCGAFVPISFIPDSVLVISRCIPTYWFIQNNELISKLEVFNFDSLKPVLNNSLIILGFTVGLIIITNLASKKKAN